MDNLKKFLLHLLVYLEEIELKIRTLTFQDKNYGWSRVKTTIYTKKKLF